MICVFKTSVKTKKDVGLIGPSLNEVLPVASWNFDLKDCDKILRVISPLENPEMVVNLLQQMGYDCEEL